MGGFRLESYIHSECRGSSDEILYRVPRDSWGHWLHRSSGLLDKTVLAIPEHAALSLVPRCQSTSLILTSAVSDITYDICDESLEPDILLLTCHWLTELIGYQFPSYSLHNRNGIPGSSFAPPFLLQERSQAFTFLSYLLVSDCRILFLSWFTDLFIFYECTSIQRWFTYLLK